MIGPSTRPIATEEQLSFRTTCLGKIEPLVLVNKIQYSKIKLQNHKKSSSETEQFTKIMWVVGCSQSATYECYHSHKWLTNDDHCAKQEMLHHISMRLSSRLELRSVPSNSELELLAGLRIRMVDPRNGGPPEWWTLGMADPRNGGPRNGGPLPYNFVGAEFYIHTLADVSSGTGLPGLSRIKGR